MLDPVYRTATFLCQLVARLPIGTNLGMAHLLWTLIAGHFLPSRGAIFPALANAGANDKECRQSEAALRDGKWNVQLLLVSGKDSCKMPTLRRFDGCHIAESNHCSGYIV